jgi:hypothetical protein
MTRFAGVLVNADRLRQLGVRPAQVEKLIRVQGVAAYCESASPSELLAAFLEAWFLAHTKPGAAGMKLRYANSEEIPCTAGYRESLHQLFMDLLHERDVRRELRAAWWKVTEELHGESVASVDADGAAERGVGKQQSNRIANASSVGSAARTTHGVTSTIKIDLNPAPVDQSAGMAGSTDAVARAAPAPAAPLAPPVTAKWTWLPPEEGLPSRRQGSWLSSVDGFGSGEALGPSERFVAAVARGRGHKQDALFCDDSFEYSTAGKWRVVVASDGAGSARFSRVGSEQAAGAVKRSMERKLAEIDIGTLREADLQQLQENPVGDDRTRAIIEAFESGFAEAMAAVSRWVEQKNSLEHGPSNERKYIDHVMRGTAKESSRANPENPDELLRISESDCNCTLLVAAYTVVKLLKSDGTTREMAMVVSCAVGDGMIAVFRRLSAAAPHAILLMAPDTGQYAGQTQFLSRASAQPESVRGRVTVRFAGADADIVAVAAMTDGVADDFYEGEVGMERLYCDLVLNGLLQVAASSQEVAKQRAWAEQELRARADAAALEIATLEKELLAVSAPADQFRLNQRKKSLEAQAARATLESLVAQESIFSSTAGDAPERKNPIKYASIYAAALGLTPREFLARPGLLHAIAEVSPSTLAVKPDPEDPSQSARDAAERLFMWIDTYIVKGSFDDRSLVMFETGVPA